MSAYRRNRLNKLLQFLLVASLTMITASVAAEVKVGYVSVERIMQSPLSLETGKKLQKEFGARNAELQRFKKQIEDREASLEKDTLTMSENDRRSKYQELSSLKLEFDRKQREQHEDFNIRKNEEMSNLQDRINKAVTAVSKAEGYDLVIYGTAAYVGKRVDITDKVIKTLGK
jgi:outer membrane protein